MKDINEHVYLHLSHNEANKKQYNVIFKALYVYICNSVGSENCFYSIKYLQLRKREVMAVSQLIFICIVETVLLAKLFSELILEYRVKMLFLDNYDSAKNKLSLSFECA